MFLTTWHIRERYGLIRKVLCYFFYLLFNLLDMWNYLNLKRSCLYLRCASRAHHHQIFIDYYVSDTISQHENSTIVYFVYKDTQMKLGSELRRTGKLFKTKKIRDVKNILEGGTIKITIVSKDYWCKRRRNNSNKIPKKRTYINVSQINITKIQILANKDVKE